MEDFAPRLRKRKTQQIKGFLRVPVGRRGRDAHETNLAVGGLSAILPAS
jgi:hypothetical protein